MFEDNYLTINDINLLELFDAFSLIILPPLSKTCIIDDIHYNLFDYYNYSSS